MFTADILKQKYSLEGYLPDYPPHLISDGELYNAFLPLNYFDFHQDKNGRYECVVTQEGWQKFQSEENIFWFKDNYPLISDELLTEYKNIISELAYHMYMDIDQEVDMPDWVYSYMLGSVVGPNSSQPDRHDLLVMLNADNIEDEFTHEAAIKCKHISEKWLNSISKADRQHRPATIFGELHVIKQLRLRSTYR